MIWMQAHSLELLALLLYTAVMVYHAWSGNRQTGSLADYFVGGRSIGGITAGLSFFATYASTNSFVGFSGQAHDFGLPWLLLVPFAVGLSLLSWVVIAPRLRKQTESLGSLTIPDFIGFRFGSHRARVAAALIVLFASFIYTTAVFKGIGNLLEAFLDVSYWHTIFIVLVIVVAYTAVGGFHSVVQTDVVQGVIMIGAAILLFWGTTQAAGGLHSIYQVKQSVEGARLFSWDAAMPLPMLLGVLFATTIKFVVEPRQLSRFYALSDPREARRGGWISTLSFLVVFSLLAPVGLYARNLLPQHLSDTDRVVPALLASGAVFGPIVSALLVLAMVSAAMSSLDSVLLVMASTCERDLVGLWRGTRSEESSIGATRIYVLVFAVLAALIALDPPGSVVALTSFSGSLYAACFLPAIVLGLYWQRGDGRSVLASFTAGILCLACWDYLPPAEVVHRVFPAVLCSLLTYAVVACFSSWERPSE